jgi:outer membrane receptor protein involved in Fe transport
MPKFAFLQSTNLDLIYQINQVIIYQIQMKNQRIVLLFWKHSFETRLGPAGRPEAGTGPSLRKNRERKNPRWPSWPGKTRSKTQLQSVDFCFFCTKTTSFWFFLKKNWPRQSGQNQEPGPWTELTTGSGLKTIFERIL